MSDETAGIYGAICFIVIALGIGLGVGNCCGERTIQIEAVEKGKAEWVPLPNGETEFHWKEEK